MSAHVRLESAAAMTTPGPESLSGGGGGRPHMFLRPVLASREFLLGIKVEPSKFLPLPVIMKPVGERERVRVKWCRRLPEWIYFPLCWFGTGRLVLSAVK